MPIHTRRKRCLCGARRWSVLWGRRFLSTARMGPRLQSVFSPIRPCRISRTRWIFIWGGKMNPRNRVFMILGLLTVGSLIWYFVTTRHTTDLKLIGTVDANEVLVSSKIPGRIQTLTVDEGQTVKAGELIATIESDDL